MKLTCSFKGLLAKRIAAMAAAALMTAALVPTAAFAITSGSYNELANAGETGTLSTMSVLPAQLDLRDVNGHSYIGPVRHQGEHGTCWAFGATCASESAIISGLDWADNSQLDGSVDYDFAAASADGTLAKAASDLSERHLAWFGNYCLAKAAADLYPSQAGEGSYVFDEYFDWVGGSWTSDARVLWTGGTLRTTINAYASGIGPVAESVAPYVNDEGEYTSSGYPSGKGTWSVNDSLRFESVTNILQCNILPDSKNNNEAGVQAIKETLNNGQAVSISYYADGGDGDEDYMNCTNYAQYTFDEDTGSNHTVAIVGYDDMYSKDNFTHTVYQRDENGDFIKDASGQKVEDTERTALTTPQGDGAWIVRNSWGSGWGNDGYFYLSYYDMSINGIECFTYDVTQSTSQTFTDQYDLAGLESLGAESSDQAGYYQMCNVFDGPESGVEQITAVGVQTGDANVTTQISVYVMDESVEDPTEYIDNAAAPDATVTQTCGYAGFYRIELDEPLAVTSGQKYAVVQSNTKSDESSEVVFSYGASEEFTQKYYKNYDMCNYYQTVINQGESFLREDGLWYNWDEYTQAMNKGLIEDEGITDMSQYYVYDNLSIKAYVTQTSAHAVSFKDADGSDLGITSQAVEDGALPQWPASFAREGYVLAGWYTDAARTQAYDFTVPVTGDLTLYAGWVAAGDLNDSGKVNIVDAQIVYDLATNGYGVGYVDYPYTALWGADAVKLLADVNADGTVDALDAFALQVLIM